MRGFFFIFFFMFLLTSTANTFTTSCRKEILPAPTSRQGIQGIFVYRWTHLTLLALSRGYSSCLSANFSFSSSNINDNIFLLSNEFPSSSSAKISVVYPCYSEDSSSSTSILIDCMHRIFAVLSLQLAAANTGSCVGPHNNIGHPA